ncbi:MAG: alpha/beta hydrolase [Chloroflexota bacterium]|nr:alpha/beta hydrolase [Chloroflexota bacterium]
MPYAKISTGPVYYELNGSAYSGERPLVLFFNGWCLSSRYWEETVRYLEKEWTLLNYDGRGFGRSSSDNHPLEDKVRFTIESSADEAEELLAFVISKAKSQEQRDEDEGAKRQKHKVHVVGHSLGAVTATHFASRLEAQGLLASLTIINSGSFEPNVMQGSTLSLFVSIFVLTKNLFDLPLLRNSVVGRSINQPIAEQYARVITRDFVEADRWAALELSRSSLTVPTLKRYRRELETLKSPLLLIVGDKDATIPPAGMYNIKRFKPAADLVAFPDCGHLPMLERAERFAESLGNHFRVAESEKTA